MARHWQPKFRCKCKQCGWESKRTLVTMVYPCPICSGMVKRHKVVLRCSRKISRTCSARSGECEHSVNHYEMTGRCGGWKKCIDGPQCRCVRVKE